MTTHINNLSTNFQDILTLHSEIISKKFGLLGKLQDLKNTYNELLKQNTKKIFVFCLDSLFFQYKTLSIEIEDISRYTALINNRMYGDYYKLYKIILEQSATDLNIDVENLAEAFKKYLHYRELEPFHEYKPNDIIQLHSDILTVLKNLYFNYASKIKTMHEYNTNISAGISINNFLHTLEHEHSVLQEHIHLYINYLEFFHTSQNGYLCKLMDQVERITLEIDDDVMTTRRTQEVSTSPKKTLNALSSSLAFKNKPNLDEFFADKNGSADQNKHIIKSNPPPKSNPSNNDENEAMVMNMRSPVVQENKEPKSPKNGENITISVLGTGTGMGPSIQTLSVKNMTKDLSAKITGNQVTL